MHSLDLPNLAKSFTEFVKKYEFVVVLASAFTIYYILSASELQKKKEDIYDVIVIGAGFSGIGASKAIFDNDIKSFIVLESKDYIGGRVRKTDFAGVQVPLGAGWIHKIEENSLLWRLASENGISYYVDDYDDLTYREPGLPASSILDRWKEAADRLDGHLESGVKEVMSGRENDIGLDEGLRLSGWQAESKLEKSVEYLKVDFENGNPASRLSSFDFPFTGEGQDVVITDERGFEYIAEILARPFIEKIFLNHDVLSVIKDGDLYSVKTSNGDTFKSAYVLVSFSNTVLQSERVEFRPSLPMEKLNALANILTGDYCKIFFHFFEKFWENSNYIIIGKEEKKYVHWQNLNRVFPGHNILMTTLTGDECKHSQLQDDNTVITEAVEVLRSVYGNIPYPTDMIRSNWSYDPYVLGAYSNPTIGTTRQDYETIRAPINGGTLWFTGEHTGDKSGYVHGALEHGIETGKQLAQTIDQNRRR